MNDSFKPATASQQRRSGTADVAARRAGLPRRLALRACARVARRLVGRSGRVSEHRTASAEGGTDLERLHRQLLHLQPEPDHRHLHARGRRTADRRQCKRGFAGRQENIRGVCQGDRPAVLLVLYSGRDDQPPRETCKVRGGERSVCGRGLIIGCRHSASMFPRPPRACARVGAPRMFWVPLGSVPPRLEDREIYRGTSNMQLHTIAENLMR
jgi:hypothetical protein